MNISTDAIAEIEQIYYSIANGAETPFQEYLRGIAAECGKQALEKEVEPLLNELEKTDKNTATALYEAIMQAVTDYEKSGFTRGFLYARVLLT